MKWLYFLFAFISSVLAVTTTSTSVSRTTVWATGTDSAGLTVTTQSIFTQTFMTTYTTTTGSVSSGSIGLGTISGSVGGIRTYSYTTITNAGNSNKPWDGSNLKSVSFALVTILATFMGGTILFL
ncbi:predicted GPI-anchored protein 1 [[Candida] railenensis]|uniref:Predicted GPI-anchored protein 1 n=1 Tax=[Candida] railenensis TaxID=45579 RepID=A0A9P0QN29_9ASCO|nr:predicted GPI-anchored protein 1 [[Candida] railenensis]